MTRKLFTLLIMFLTMVGNAVWGQSGTSGNPYTGNRSETLTLSAGTYYMEDFHINTSGIAVELTGNVTLVIKGECSFISTGNLGIQIPEKTATLTISEESTGILRVDGNRSSNNGILAVGGDKNNESLMGAFIVNGGTVYVLGNMGHNGNHGSIEMHDGAAFVDGNIYGNKQISDGGILFDRTAFQGEAQADDTWYGRTFDDITLNSPITGDIDGDGDMDNDKIRLDLQGHTLTIGRGNKIYMGEDQFSIVEGSGNLAAYKVVYNTNATNGCTISGEAPTDYWYYGPETTFDVLGESLTCTGNSETNGQHQFFGYVNMSDNNKTVLEVGTDPEKTSTTPTDEITNAQGTEGVPVNMYGAWGALKRTLTTTNHVKMDDAVLLASPEGVITYGDISEETLPNGIEFNKETGTFSGTPDVEDAQLPEDGNYTITVPITVKGRESETFNATIIINVDDNKPDLDSENTTIDWSTPGEDGIRPYNGNVYKLSDLIDIKAGNRPDQTLVDGTHYTVTYDYIANPEESDFTGAQNDIHEIKNAGKYKVTKIEAATNTDDEAQIGGNLEGNELKIDDADIIITITRATLTLTINQQRVPVGGSFNTNITVDGENPTASYSGVVEADENDGISKISFNGSLSANINTEDVGSGTITASDVSINEMEDNKDGDIRNNYTVTVSNASGATATVYSNSTADDITPVLNPDPTEGEEGGDENVYDGTTKTFTFPYDGNEYTLSKLLGTGDVEIEFEPEDVTYSYSATEDVDESYIEFADGQKIKNAGWYKISISLDRTSYPSITEALVYKVHITKRPLTITALEQTIRIGGETDEEVDLVPSFGSEEGQEYTIKVENVVTDETVSFKTEDANKLELSSDASTAVTNETPSKYEDAITQGSLALADNNDANANYTISTDEGATFTPGDLIIIRVLGEGDKDDITGGDDGENKDGNFTDNGDYQLIGGNGEDIIYNGQPYEVKDLYWKVGTESKPIKNFEVTYAVDSDVEDNPAELSGTDDKQAINAGHYTATIKITSSTEEGSENYFETSDSESLVFKFEIKQAQLTVTGSYECEETPTTVSASDVTDLAATGLVNNEQVSFSGNLKVENNNLVPDTDFKLEATANTAFKETNYNISYNITLTVTGEGGDSGDDDDKTELDPNGDDKDNTTGGDEGDDNEFPSDDDFILLSPSGASSSDVYDGQEHGLTILKIGEYTLREGTDYNEIETYTPTKSNQANVGSNGLPKHVNTYSAEITLVEGSGYKWPDNAESYTLTGMTINERPMLISFVSEVASEADLRDINKLVQYEPMAGDRGLVLYEQPIVEATISDVTELGNGHYRVTIDRESFTISNNEGNFYLSDYTIALDADGDDSGDYNVTDEDNDGTGGLDDGDGDITIDVTIDPNKPNFPDFGGGGIHKPIEYYNIYIDTVCPGIKLELSKDVVKGGNEVSVYLTIQSECDTTGMRFEYKRGLFGWWDDLKVQEGTQPGEYIIKNIYTDIYIRALDATMPDDATGLEEVEGVKAYAQDGNIYVYTPNRMPVWIVSMTGAVLRNEEQVGLQAYDRLTRGIYIVRVGEQVFKIRL